MVLRPGQYRGIKINDLVTGQLKVLHDRNISDFKLSYLKIKIAELLNIDAKLVSFFWNDSPLTFDDNMTCSECGIDTNSEFSVSYQTYKDIIKHQNVEGYWKSEILDQVGRTIEEVSTTISELITSQISTLEDQLKVICTVIAIKTLKSKYSHKQKEWRLIAMKGIKYLQNKGFDFNTLEIHF